MFFICKRLQTRKQVKVEKLPYIESEQGNNLRCKPNYYRPQRSWGKVMFLHVSVILFTGGGLPHCMLRYTPPDQKQAPTQSRHPLGSGTPGTRHPPAHCMLGDTGNKRAVCILLECNLVNFKLTFFILLRFVYTMCHRSQ